MSTYMDLIFYASKIEFVRELETIRVFLSEAMTWATSYIYHVVGKLLYCRQIIPSSSHSSFNCETHLTITSYYLKYCTPRKRALRITCNHLLLTPLVIENRIGLDRRKKNRIKSWRKPTLPHNTFFAISSGHFFQLQFLLGICCKYA